MAKNKTGEITKHILEKKDVLIKIEEFPKGYIQGKIVSGHVNAFSQWRKSDKVNLSI